MAWWQVASLIVCHQAKPPRLREPVNSALGVTPNLMQLLLRFRDWFVSGLAFSLAVLAVALLWQSYLKELIFPSPSYTVHNPSDIAVVAIEPTKVTKSAGVTATLKNTSTSVHYKPAGYELLVLLGEQRLGSCSSYEERPDLPPGATGQIQITCQDMERTSLPNGATFKLVVRSAWRFK